MKRPKGFGMSEKILVFCAFLAAIFAIPYITTMLVNGMQEEGSDELSIKGSDRRVCINEDGGYEIIDAEEYLFYVLAGQADCSWNEEMYRVMAVIYRTSIYYQMNELAGDGDDKIIEEGKLEEVRYGEASLKELLADDYDFIIEQAALAVSDTSGQIIMYQGSAIMPVYHEISIGNTVSATEVYDVELPYLQAVDSSQDVTAEDFSGSVCYSGSRLKKLFSDADISEDFPADSVEIIEATESGFAKWVNVYGHKVSGYHFADVLGLQSQNFHIEKNQDDTYNIICIGKGSSVGLSLYGACYMAENGSSYTEILTTYYTDVRIGARP